MSERAFFLDRSPGEDRAVVTLDGCPERLLLARSSDDVRLKIGARLIGRVKRVEPALATAFIDLGPGAEAILQIRPDARPIEGQALEVEVRSEPRLGKLAIVRELGAAEGAPRLLAAPPSLSDQLRGLARGGEVVEGRRARAVAEAAQEEILATLHPLPGGGELAIEPTRALTAIDIDVGERKGGDAKRVTRQANLVALGVAARLLRLKGLGGIVVIDLVGRGHDGIALMSAARAAFSPDNPGVAIGPVTKFGTMQLSIPRRTAPLRDILVNPEGALSDETLALRLLRELQEQAQAQPGARFACVCAPAVCEAAKPFADILADQVGRRFSISADPTRPRDLIEVKAL